MLDKDEINLLEENINSRIVKLFGSENISKTIATIASKVFAIGIEEYENLRSK